MYGLRIDADVTAGKQPAHVLLTYAGKVGNQTIETHCLGLPRRLVDGVQACASRAEACDISLICGQSIERRGCYRGLKAPAFPCDARLGN
ncbi:hypothetical protein GCM10009304_05370 [Pseudomonas matsuisoli]|uniref:Uncharacterized protein n=1 Tax=Pseudomonas matsuisoli TaxID=1515666 RepID=A0A917USK4_9PSED|nr:hypothetical protein GCM10009304_05370 [Pseudomonas matsuisoli]